MSADGLSAAARRHLLSLARRAIEGQLRGAPRMAEDLGELRAELEPLRGAFVTLTRRRDGELRGCVGVPEPLYRLDEAVAHAAVAAAVHDGRFDPVAASELPELSLHVSVLGELAPIDPHAVQVGVHGLVIRCGGRRGLLLPQVAAERGWDRERFLDEACRKAGLAAGAWRQGGCEILAFTAVVFSDDEETDL
jgi:AmmeMemoRadiSam system protein A